MKKLLLSLLFIVASMSAYASELTDAIKDYGKTLTEILVKRTDGYIIEEYEGGYLYNSTIQVPDYYDNQLIITVMKPIVADDDFITVTPWSKMENGNGIRCAYKLYDAVDIYFGYNNIKQELMILLIPIRDE